MKNEKPEQSTMSTLVVIKAEEDLIRAAHEAGRLEEDKETLGSVLENVLERNPNFVKDLANPEKRNLFVDDFAYTGNLAYLNDLPEDERIKFAKQHVEDAENDVTSLIKEYHEKDIGKGMPPGPREAIENSFGSIKGIIGKVRENSNKANASKNTKPSV